MELNDRAHEVLQRQDELAGALFDAGFKGGFYDNRDARFAVIREASKRHVADTRRSKVSTIDSYWELGCI